MRKHVYKVGDIIRILEPKFIHRVGYPLHPSDFAVEVSQSAELAAALKILGFENIGGRAKNKLVEACAFAKVSALGFGGRTRSIHYKKVVPYGSMWTDGEVPDVSGQTQTVHAKKTVMTGTYYAPSSSQSWDGEYDYDPGGLENRKSHVLLKTCRGWIEQCHVEFVRRPA